MTYHVMSHDLAYYVTWLLIMSCYKLSKPIYCQQAHWDTDYSNKLEMWGDKIGKGPNNKGMNDT